MPKHGVRLKTRYECQFTLGRFPSSPCKRARLPLRCSAAATSCCDRYGTHSGGHCQGMLRTARGAKTCAAMTVNGGMHPFRRSGERSGRR